MDELCIGLIGGSGLAEALGAESAFTRHALETPFGPPSDAIVETTWANTKVLLLARHGNGHLLNPSQVPYRANLFALKSLGCTHILASGAVGSLRQEYKPRDLVLPDQIIDRTTRRPNTFYEHAAVHVEFAEPFCPVLRRMIMEGKGQGGKGQGQAKDEMPNVAPSSLSSLAFSSSPLAPAFTIHNGGCYVAMEGPAFSTRAESLMHRLWGGDLIGMTAMPEAKLAREAEIPYALVALVTDYDSWQRKSSPSDGDMLLEEIVSNLRAASQNALDLMKQTVEYLSANREALDQCPARSALKSAIWSDRSKISPDEVRRLAPLWGKYFA